jgi:hypothetical protein
VKSVAEALEVSRSQLSARLSGERKPRSTYSKVGDADLLAPLRSLVDERPTYGYRRIGALMNRERLKNGQPRLNHKRIYRLMSQNGMLLQRYTGKPPGRAHDGKIVTIRPNLRWTSGLRSRAGTVKWFAWPLRWILATARPWRGARAPVASAER